jgi:hypothetical protein
MNTDFFPLFIVKLYMVHHPILAILRLMR